MGETAGGDARRWDLRAGRFIRAVAEVAGMSTPAGSHARTAAPRMPS
jgi:hypothetical protein